MTRYGGSRKSGNQFTLKNPEPLREPPPLYGLPPGPEPLGNHPEPLPESDREPPPVTDREPVVPRTTEDLTSRELAGLIWRACISGADFDRRGADIHITSKDGSVSIIGFNSELDAQYVIAHMRQRGWLTSRTT